MTDPVSDDASQTMSQPLEWRDGDMPYSSAFGDHFYCQTDGRLECSHVFLDGNGLPARWHGRSEFRIGELGFGTALNFCETWRQWKTERSAGATLHFMSFELYPMRAQEIDRALSRWPEIDDERKALVTCWPETPEGIVSLQLDEQTRLSVVCGPALDGVGAAETGFDAWFLDGFAPSRNGDMWSPELMQLVHDKTSQGGTFATYAAAGFVRRNLQAAGFAVERRKGFAGKREMLCGVRGLSDA
ncbi:MULTISPECIES: tRNA (5-methylaminomethyl-2-thiouridine)(34)-methyltransferase MnmD [Rhizobium]|uniref:tRNA (5-methylaminomethyl-2-thiouridine)(34)-methyltransferase MnmD n=1 Tax=Rhizobium rhododendri TaxID=2506430 RepID=A0ABY8ID47_9HYPH|nr:MULTISPECIES: tRNA (5-methylaminomethyl-2-thiouridine)(34)-methyltransferase MnmD [Rhizobium]MBZ5758785.1 tRNA (5-methylaminomethyl-2-thiouridine)(34)-methyltransferase MnmD [Rhizobium sp. VS19-DR96]MBZ5764385.1 tRNA (5-methylaminomethyl-2-thiouridine)(34)-methyltransferase MnmD [Rhizobium sp. VS19-DR129.2]MBZ5771928.1 tRNA (5-methylaminomethyl-2-thiouridine)(34)-methyltransferase MnmD [Rhizobium sp. VS19-DRK62.2]MBZ5783385.1 tRNA (5-methylaminomethyl-2-thiouridine)(34)-methyltransferase Mnm